MTHETRADIDEAVRILRDAGAREVFIFGSVAEDVDTADSDIDLAVRGVRPESFYEVAGRLALALHRDFDLVDMDESTPFTDYLEREGKIRRVA